MARTVFANNRNFSHKGSSDKSICSAPDVCKTPMGNSTPPIPYGVVSQAADASGYTKTVFIDGNPTATESSVHTQCSGDAPGSAKGTGSGTTGDKTHFTSYSFDVKCEGEGVVRHLDTTTMNNRNTAGSVFGISTAASVIKEKELPTEPQILQFTLLPLPGMRESTFINEPCKLYADGGLLKNVFTDDQATVEWEHKEGTKQYKVELTTGQEFLIDIVEEYSPDKKTQSLQRLSNLGYRSFNYEGDAPLTFDGNGEEFRRLEAEQGG
jgi:uncharacterized protein DUF4150